MLTVVFKNGEQVYYKESEYTDYHYDGKVFVVIDNLRWIAMYNIDSISCMFVSEDE